MNLIREFINVHPGFALVICGVVYLLGLLLLKPLPDRRDSGSPDDFPRI